MCDCVLRNSTNEYFWNGAYCQKALNHGSSCVNSASTYMCQYMGQGTVCSGVPGNYTCQCSMYMYFDSTAGYCKNQTLVNTACSFTLSCRIDLGLICQNSLCVCNSTAQFWSTSALMCINYYTYVQSGCLDNSQCASTLICNNSTNTKCNCPLTLSTGTCDCTRSYGNEYYWNGVQCVPAQAYNQPCSNGTSFADYVCQTLTQYTNCNNISKTCQCSSNGGFNPVTNKCVDCVSGWRYFNLKCFYFSSASFSSITTPTGSSPDFNISSVHAACNNNNSATYAVISTSQYLNFLTSILPNGIYWVGATRGGQSCCAHCLTPNTFNSADGSWNLGTSTWCTSFPVDKSGSNCNDCVAYNTIQNCYENHLCSDNYPVICEI